MVTRIGRGRRHHLYIKEWFDHLHVSDETVAGRVGVSRETIWKWRTQPQRLNTDKLEALAFALGISPRRLYQPPATESLDDLVEHAPDEVKAMAADIVKRLVNKAS